jgi:hypothetical protein
VSWNAARPAAPGHRTSSHFWGAAVRAPNPFSDQLCLLTRLDVIDSIDGPEEGRILPSADRRAP